MCAAKVVFNNIATSALLMSRRVHEWVLTNYSKLFHLKKKKKKQNADAMYNEGVRYETKIIIFFIFSEIFAFKYFLSKRRL